MKLDIGCGAAPREGFVGIDRKLGREAFPLTLDGEPMPDESVEEIVASHVLEHFPHGQVDAVLTEWIRVLQPGGVLRIAVPNLKWIATNYLAGANISVQGYLMGGQTDGDDFHKTAFDEELLSNLFRQHGLSDIQQWAPDKPDCAALPCSLNLQGTKARPLPPMKVACAMSVPRLGFQDNFFCWVNALLPLGISPTKYEGAFWCQCLERILTKHSAPGAAEWILTLDYDSVFSREHVVALLRVAAENPNVDAVAAVQMARGRDGAKPLFVRRNGKGEVMTKISNVELAKPLLKVQTAHFGLTLIRAAALRKMPHPWFLGVPDKDGTWEEGRIDADIHFWHQWEAAGNSLYVANRVVVGHAELMITWPDGDFNPIHQYPSDYHERGLPEKVWQ